MMWKSVLAFVFASLVFVESTDNSCFFPMADLQGVEESQGSDLFVQIGKGFYFVERQNKVNWYEANAICRRHNAQLASIETAEEMEAIEAYLKHENFKDWIWLSGSDLSKEKTFVWSGTGQPFVYTNWLASEPNNAGGIEHCVHMWHDHDWTWNDVPCNLVALYICESTSKIFNYQLQLRVD